MVAFVLLASISARASGVGGIDSTNKYAWSENAGWINFAPSNGTAVVDMSCCLSGYVWAENVGWIKLGNDNGGPYLNTTVNNWGVNVQSGVLSGYAWSENVGWIRFSPTGTSTLVNREDGRFSGYAWSENVGWIHFYNETPFYNVKASAGLLYGTVLSVK